MANWISSKLKVAETFFEQIDQQAAESLKKNETPLLEKDFPVSALSRSSSGGTLPLKDQLKKKNENLLGNFATPNLNNPPSNVRGTGQGKESLEFSRHPPKPKPTLTENDWTELLSTPTKRSETRVLKKVSSNRFSKEKKQIDGDAMVKGKMTVKEVKQSFASEKKSIGSGPTKVEEKVTAVKDTRVDDSDSESDSSGSSGYDSEKEKVNAAERALEAIKERENLVARLEGEKLSLEKILEEEARLQVREASELQTSMIQTMEAVEAEKQKHNATMKEALARLAKLEMENGDQARRLAVMQKNLESEEKEVALLRHNLNLQELALQDLKWSDDNALRRASTSSLKSLEVERSILESEYSFLTEKISAVEGKCRKLAEGIEMMNDSPTEVEVELKRRLEQMTDRLIHKQAQVEALSSEKATLTMRIETVSRLLEEGESLDRSKDVESGTVGLLGRSPFEENVWDHIGTVIQRLDYAYSYGAVFVRRNSFARKWFFFYFICLHILIFYVLLSHANHDSAAALSQAASYR